MLIASTIRTALLAHFLSRRCLDLLLDILLKIFREQTVLKTQKKKTLFPIYENGFLIERD